MSYSLFILPRAQREMASLNARDRERVKEGILQLREDPRPANCKKLTGREGWRIRIGDYRVVYEVDDSSRSVTILDIGHRREVYR